MATNSHIENSDERIGTVILFFARFCKDNRKVLTKTLLNKFLASIDFGHYALHQAPITTFNYNKDHYGPVPMEAGYYTDKLARDSKVFWGIRYHDGSGNHYESIELGESVKKVNLEPLFSAKEISTITLTAKAFKRMNAAEASKESHDQYVWITAPSKGEIKYEGAKYCTFEWLNYFGEGKTEEDYKETKSIRKRLASSPELVAVMERAMKANGPIRTTRRPKSRLPR